MMCGWKRGLWLMVLSCWVPAAMAEEVKDFSPVDGVVKPRPKTDNPSSADFFFRQDATPEEDYQAGIVAYNRAELIEAQGIFERAAKRGHTGAMTRLAEIFNKTGFIKEAVEMYLKAASLGNVDAMFGLGEMYLDLNSYDMKHPDAAADPVEARKWFQRAAEGGHKDAINLVAGMYMSGGGMGGMLVSDAERTDAEVMKWIKRAIDVNQSPLAMDALARAYREGKYGLQIDTKLADEWAAKTRKAWGIKEEEAKKSKKKRIM